MKQMFDIDLSSYSQSVNYTRPRSSPRDEEGCIIPCSRIDDYQTSISNFSKRNESDKKKIKKGKKNVQFNPFIGVINIESYKKESYEANNEEFLINNNQQKCLLCSIF